MSILLFLGINICMESNKINLKLLNLGQIQLSPYVVTQYVSASSFGN